MKLTTHFGSEHFAVSDSHPELVKPVPSEYLPRVRSLALLLQELQDWLDATYGPSRYRIRITSGYRPPLLNSAVGGESSSLHLTGDAADLIVVDSGGRTMPTLLPVLYGQVSSSMVGRIGEVELSTVHLHLSNRVGSNADEFMVLLKEPMKRFAEAPTEEQLAIVATAFMAILAVRRL